MSEKFRPTLAIHNAAPLTCLGTQTSNLALVHSKRSTLVNQTEHMNVPPAAELVGTMQILLRAEARFLERLRALAADRCRIKSDVETIQRELNHENVIHVARFFFLLKALDCSTPEAVEALIDGHNRKVRTLIEQEDFQIRTRKELEKSAFKDAQQYICIKTVKEQGRAVFAKTELAALLFDHMSRDSAIKAIDLLVRAGLLFEADSDPLTGSNRKLIKTDGVIEDAMAEYLNEVNFAAREGAP